MFNKPWQSVCQVPTLDQATVSGWTLEEMVREKVDDIKMKSKGPG